MRGPIKRILVFLCSMMLILGLSGIAGATTYTFDVDVGVLEHDYYYIYGIDWELPTGEVIEGASLSFNQIKNLYDDTETLYVHLLDYSAAGLTIGMEDSTVVNDNYFDYYTGTNIHLFTWNISPTPKDLTYNFDSSEVTTLITYLADGNFGLGFDPDCKYSFNEITCTCCGTCCVTAPIPEPATMLLFGTGLIGLAGLGRKKFFKK